MQKAYGLIWALVLACLFIFPVSGGEPPGEANSGQASPAGGVCLHPDEIDGVVGAALRTPHSLIVKDRRGQKFLITTSGWCHDLDLKTATFSSCVKAGDWIPSTGKAATYTFGTVTGSTGPRCIISCVKAYSADMDQTAPSP
ncbi:MAG: hypothetical protein WCD42_14185 [Rhizomicrobium sp.]